MANPNTEIIISAKDRTRQAFEAVEKRFTSLDVKGRVLGGTLGTLGGLFTVSTIAAWTKDAIDAADSMSDLSQRTGIAVEELSGWQYAVKMSDTSMESLSGALSKASKYLVENGDDLKKLGIEANNSTDVIVGLADVISSLPVDDPRRMAVAMQVLGKSAADLMPLLSEGADGIRSMLERGKELNPVTQEMADKAGEFNDKLDELKIASSGLAMTWAGELLPSLTRGLDLLTAISKFGMGGLVVQMEIDSGEDPIKRLTEIEGKLQSLYKLRADLSKDRLSNHLNNFLFNDLVNVEDQIKVNEKAMLQIGQYLDTPDYASKRIEELQDKLERLGQRIRNLNETGTNPGLVEKLTRDAKAAANELTGLAVRVHGLPKDVKNPNVDGFLKNNTKTQIDQGQKYIDQLNERIALVGRVGEAEQLVAKIQVGSMKFSSAAQAEQALSLAEQLDLAQKQIEITKQQEAAAASAATQFQALNDRLFPDDAKAIEYNEQLQLLYMTLDQNPTRLAEAVKRLHKEFYGDKLGDEMKKRSEEFAALTDRLFPERSKSIQYYADLKLIEDQLAAMNITAKEASEATRRLTNEFEKSSDQMSEFAIQAARNIQTTLGDTLYEGLNGRFDSIGESFNRMLTRMMADLAASQLAESLFGSFGTTGKMGGLVGSLFGSAGSGSSNASPGIVLNANGGVYDSPSLSQYSNSIVDSPTMFAFAKGAGLMGEAGPEAIMPLSRDSSGRLGVVVAGADRPAINVQVNIVGASSQPRVETSMGADGSLTMDIIFEQVESFLNRRVSRGQGLAETFENKYGLNPAAGANG